MSLFAYLLGLGPTELMVLGVLGVLLFGRGNKSGSGRGVPDTHVSSKRGGRLGGAAAARRPAAARRAAAKKAAATRARRRRAGVYPR